MSHESDGNNAFKIELDSSPPGFEREQSLASKFDHINPTDLVNETMGHSPLSIVSGADEAQPLVFEVTEAVQELVNEVKQGKKTAAPTSAPQVGVFPRGAEITIAAMPGAPDSLEMTGLGFSATPESFQAPHSPTPAYTPATPAIAMTPMPKPTATPVAVVYENETPDLQATYESFCDLILCQSPFDQLAEKILQVMISCVGADSGSILELDHDSEELFFRFSQGGASASQLKSFRIPATSGIAGMAIEGGTCISVNDFDKSTKQMTSVGLATNFHPKACLATPLFIDDRLYGVVEIFNSKTNAKFTEENVKTMNRVAQIAAKILEERFLIAELLGRAKK